MGETLGRVHSVESFGSADGPGVRYIVFLKGCNMRCQWCHNPETISFEREMLFYPEKCIGCGMCDEGCFAGAKVPCGDRMTVDDVFQDIQLDQPYYGKDGGVTVSGGEPLCQPEFARALLIKVPGKPEFIPPLRPILMSPMRWRAPCFPSAISLCAI